MSLTTDHPVQSAEWPPPERPTSTPPPAERPPRHDHPHLRGFARGVAIAITLIVVPGIARVLGVPLVLTTAAVLVGIAVGCVLRRRAGRRTRPGRLLVSGVLMIGLAATSWSYTGALSDPGSAPATDRTANWMREHHMNLIVDTIEQHLYAQGTASSSVVDRASLPNTAASPTQIPSPTTLSTAPVTDPTPAASISTTASTASSSPPTTTPPVDHTPAPAGPLIDDTVAGEGQWTPNARQVNGVAVTYTTFVRPDPTHTGVVAAAVELEPTVTRLVYVPGTREPGGTGWAWGARIPADQRPDLVAAFNSGWKQNDKPGGVYTEGRTAADLIDGKASLVIYADGHNDVGAWGTDVIMSPDVVSVRQNLAPVVVNGQAVDGLGAGGSGNWGKSKYQLQQTRRSGLGITAAGALVYVAGSGLTTATLAHALVQVGAVRAMELDIHNQHPTFNFFTPAPGTPDGVTGEKLLPEMHRPATRYLAADQRDFFAVLVR